jgi:hypothetical protein
MNSRFYQWTQRAPKKATPEAEAEQSLPRTRKPATNDAACCRTPAAPKLPHTRAREYAAWFKALADPTRIRILNLLAANRDPVCVRECRKWTRTT